MITNIEYKGALVGNCDISGERKSDGVVPAHANGAYQISENRFFMVFSTLDTRGWDSVRSIVYQIRADSPDGPIIKEKRLITAENGWKPLGGEMSFRRINGMPLIFGVPKGAKTNGKPLPNENVFALMWYCSGHLEKDGETVNSENQEKTHPGLDAIPNLLHIRWLQFKLNEDESDIEIIQAPCELRQVGYETGTLICSVPSQVVMEHAMTIPIPADETCSKWVECHNVNLIDENMGETHGSVIPVEYSWNEKSGLYEWTRTGEVADSEGKTAGESSISRIGDQWIIAVRTFNAGAGTLWYKTDDLFGKGMGKPVWRPGTYAPRHHYRCPDGVLRIFINDMRLSPQDDKRNPLYMFEVDPETFEYSEPVVVFDARSAGLPFEPPVVDMSKLCVHQGNKQILIFRMISLRMTSPMGNPITPEEMDAAGIHYVEFTYDKVEKEAWRFKR